MKSKKKASDSLRTKSNTPPPFRILIGDLHFNCDACNHLLLEMENTD